MEKGRSKESSHNEYRRVRDTFNKMNVEEQATFLVEATASMLARGVEEAGRVVADSVNDIFRPKTRREHRSSDGPGPGPAEPETAQQRCPHGGTHDAAQH